MTPLLDSDAVVDLMAGAIPSEDIGWRAEKIRCGIDLVFPGMKHNVVEDEQLVLLSAQAKVTCASGESDTESIRDFDSGTSKFRYHRRKPYWYRRDNCLGCEDGSRKYRRRMKPTGESASTFGWTPEAESDEDGENNQESFALSAQVATDELGRDVGAHPDVQPTTTSQSSADDRSLACHVWNSFHRCKHRHGTGSEGQVSCSSTFNGDSRCDCGPRHNDRDP